MGADEAGRPLREKLPLGVNVKRPPMEITTARKRNTPTKAPKVVRFPVGDGQSFDYFLSLSQLAGPDPETSELFCL